jgi:hypothetical protein
MGEGVSPEEEIFRRVLLGGRRRRLLRWSPARKKLARDAGIHGKVDGGVGFVGCVLQRRWKAARGAPGAGVLRPCVELLIPLRDRTKNWRQVVRKSEGKGLRPEIGRGVT